MFYCKLFKACDPASLLVSTCAHAHMHVHLAGSLLYGILLLLEVGVVLLASSDYLHSLLINLFW